MNSCLVSFSVVMCSAALAVAQGRLEIAGYREASGEARGWSAETDDPFAALQYDELPGEVTLLFAHTTIDVSVAGERIASGVAKVYPFLAPRTDWTASSLELAQLVGVEYENTSATVSIPPGRVAAHLAAFIARNLPAEGYGTRNSGTEARLLRYHADVLWPQLEQHDERMAWAGEVWHEVQDGKVFDVGAVGTEATMLAAYSHARQLNLILNRRALEGLTDVLHQELGFEIHVQAAHMRRLVPNGPVRVRFSQTAVLRRLSLFEIAPDLWRRHMGPKRWVPSLLDPNVSVYLAGRQERMHVLFPHSVTGLRAWMMTPNGLRYESQIPNGSREGLPLRTDIAVFAVRADALSGLVYFEDGIAGVVPAQHMDGGALVWMFDPLPEHVLAAPGVPE